MSEVRTRTPGRRSHAERTAETRSRIKSAVVECIVELGFQRTTASEIARRSGLTWGAVQHHFGGKDGILRAVLEDSFQRFVDRLADLPGQDQPLDERVGLFVDRAWEHFGSADYRSTFEILMNLPPADARDDTPPWQADMLRAWSGIWERLFGDATLSRRRSLVLQHYAISTLSGLAATQMLEGAVRVRDAELALLKETLVREISAPSCR